MPMRGALAIASVLVNLGLHATRCGRLSAIRLPLKRLS
jgi:hypothetical protein